MKNTINISAAGEDLLSSVDDGTNRLFINGSEIPSASWTGSGTYSTTVQGHAITVAQIADTGGNIAIRKTAAYTYELYKIRTGDVTITGDLTVDGSISEGGTPLSQKYAPISGTGRFVPLWTGSAATFGAGSTPLSESAANFDFLICRVSYWGTGAGALVLMPTSGTTNLIVADVNTNNTFGKRSATVSGASITWTNGRWASGASGDNSSSACVPHEIFGVKL
jgi:hypothetical protein